MLQITYNDADRILLDMADEAETTTHYNQGQYGSGCGTPACMLGTYAWNHPESLAAQVVCCHHPAKRFTAYLALRAQLDLSEQDGIDLFSEQGCGNAHTDGKKAAAYVREFVRKRALARIEK